ncbi:MAG: cyclase family protein [Gaiellaceae bacterium]
MTLIEALRRARVIDASPTIRPGMPRFPGHPVLEIDSTARTHERDGYFLQTLFIGEHTGAHADAPAHAVASMAAQTIDTIPVERFVVPYLIIDLAPLGLTAGQLATREDVQAAEHATGHALESGDAALINFGWESHYDEPDDWWTKNAPGLAEDACTYLVARGIGLVGSDTATCDIGMREGAILAAHGHQTYFLPNGIPIVEGLRGLGSAPCRGVFVGAPLKVAGGSGAPLRALLISEEDQ